MRFASNSKGKAPMKQHNRISRKLTSKRKAKSKSRIKARRLLPPAVAPESNAISHRARAEARGNHKARRTTMAEGKRNSHKATMLKPHLPLLRAVAASHAIRRQATVKGQLRA